MAIDKGGILPTSAQGGSIMSRPAGSIVVCNQTLIFWLLINTFRQCFRGMYVRGVLGVANVGGSRGVF